MQIAIERSNVLSQCDLSMVVRANEGKIATIIHFAVSLPVK